MALTISELGKNNSATSTATLVVTLTQGASVGDMIVVCVAADNQGSAGAISIASVTDSKSHTYTSRVSRNNDPGTASSGASVAIFTAPVTTAMTTSDTVTINFSPNTTSKAAVLWEIAAGATEFPKYLSNGGSTGSGTNPSLQSTSIGSGDAVIYALAAESNATLTGDSDTTNGNWSTLYTDVGNTGTSLTSMRVGSQYKVTTGTATQTWNTTLTTSDWAISYIVVDPAPRIDRTATGSGTGSQSSTDVHIVLRTATGSGTSNQSADDQLVHVETATGSGVGSGTADGLVTPGTQTIERTATGSGVGSGEGDVDLVHTRTATGAGVGTSTAVGQHIHDRSATGSGVGSSNNTILETSVRTATGSGEGSSSNTILETSVRTATGSGQGTGSAEGEVVGGSIDRTATGSGAGTAVVVGLRTVIQTGSNTGSTSGSATGVVTPINPPTPSYPAGGNPWWRKQVPIKPVKEVERVPEVVSASVFATAFTSGIAVGEVSWSILEDEAELLLLL